MCLVLMFFHVCLIFCMVFGGFLFIEVVLFIFMVLVRSKGCLF